MNCWYFPYVIVSLYNTNVLDFYGNLCYNTRQDHYKYEYLTNVFYKDSIHILHEIYREYIYIYLTIFNGS